MKCAPARPHSSLRSGAPPHAPRNGWVHTAHAAAEVALGASALFGGVMGCGVAVMELQRGE